MQALITLLSLGKAILGFLMLVAAAWGVGEAIVSFITKKTEPFSKLARILVSLALGLGVIGQTAFILGTLCDFYQPEYVWFFMLVLLVFPIVKIRRNFHALEPKINFKKFGFSRLEIFIIGLITITLITWFWGLLSFENGSDVISTHYQFVKNCIGLKHFGHAVTLPFGIDNGSNYNPTLVHMLYLVGTILSDTRAANLLHWLSHVMVIMALYVFSRDYFSRSAGFMAVAIYLGFTVLFNFSMDVNNYVFLNAFMLVSIYCIFLYRKTNSIWHLFIASLLSGIMLSTKYYGVSLLLPLCIPILINRSLKMRDGIKGIVIFCLVAFVVYSPWVCYNLKEFGDPIYPFMSNIDCLNRWYVTRIIETLNPFIVSTDYSFFWPALFYYLSLFIPFEPGYRVFGLSPVLLIALPCSLYYLISAKGDKWRNVNILFVMFLVSFVIIEITTFPVAFYKSQIFAGSIYAISLSGLFTIWSKKTRYWATVIVIFVAILNTCFEYQYIKGWIHSPRITKQRSGGQFVTYVNENLENGASIANHNIRASYYLRPDIKSFPSYNICLPYDWAQEERLIRKLGIQYYVYDTNERENCISHYTQILKILNDFQSFKRIASFEPIGKFYEERTDKQKVFLEKYGQVVKEFPEGIKIYRLTLK